MRWYLLVLRCGLLGLITVLGCEKAQAPGPGDATAEKGAEVRSLPPPDTATGLADQPETPPAHVEREKPTGQEHTDGELIAVRRYEQLTNERRAGVYEVRWEWATWNGERVVKDTTTFHSRTARMMGSVKTVFESETTSVLWRRETGELLEMRSETRLARGARTDKSHTKWTGKGYRVETWTGTNHKVLFAPSKRMAIVDAESALAARIRSGEAKAGTTWTYPALHASREKVQDVKLEVIGQDEEGPGLKVVETFENNKGLWWFANDGSVVRQRAGISVIRRADVTAADLPHRPAAFQITLSSNVRLPRLFTGRRMVVEIEVETDETTQPPRIPENSFTRVLKKSDGTITVELLAHDDDNATTTLPIASEGFEEFLKPERTMEVDDPRIQRLARRIVGDEKDAREAARKLADWVFRSLGWESPPLGEPTALQILDNPTGDCSEHNLMFVTLCRAAGIPARRCSGYVCIGMWGSHAWCEIYVGKWIGADATTNEIGTRARYIMLGRPDEPHVKAGRITAERTRLRILRAEYEDGAIDIGRKYDPATMTGIRLIDPLPKGWSANYGAGGCVLSRTDLRVTLRVQPDQGRRDVTLLAGRGGKVGSFGGVPCAMRRRNRSASIVVPLGREYLVVYMSGAINDATLKQIAGILAPTLDRSDARRRSAPAIGSPRGGERRPLPDSKPGR